ncbi:uncharacterized protein CYBJADRAFT_25054 [Cyberlindnera jadinii NRRL Y-1542]|uniref:F-box domain-containing protein n=1 Tax=Cyberlindnera jadinii (strain ATCC 18201 / CBS 1600 / BCRC 20928 / JCM 3617 / NBRC 0987 / NRRL Y-1542) TaxID=983966 RepID=A0A1E4RXB5_CYBJN|nr:hypothetical protein CYBJADRAFT_25054 [Cyberlindnera jadinii NRRL Y-1542]ODV71919.1 hypothetical protein CYBJADRAFT_25054 [Cyberlindnera jadinii NRRL Y-1542]
MVTGYRRRVDMTNCHYLPPEILTTVLSYTDIDTITRSVAQVPQLKKLITLNINDLEPSKWLNTVSLSEIQKLNLHLEPLFNRYRFFTFHITRVDDDKDYMTLYRVLSRLLKDRARHVEIVYDVEEINVTHLKMLKYLFHDKPRPEQYRVRFPRLRELKTNGNHLLMNDVVEYTQLRTMNLYYCSSKFYSEVLGYLNLDRHPTTLPQLTQLKLQDYMNEEEDVYSMHSNNYVRKNGYDDDYDDDYDDYDHNSDLDENEFYFDGLEIVQNLKLTRLESLVMKNCNVSTFKSIVAPRLRLLRIMEVSNKHIEAFDLNLVDIQGEEESIKRSFLNSSVSTSCSIVGNELPQLQSLVLIGHIKLRALTNNTLGNLHSGQVLLRVCNCEVTDISKFQDQYKHSNTLLL